MRFFEAKAVQSSTNQLLVGVALGGVLLAVGLSVLLAPPAGPKVVTLQAIRPEPAQAAVADTSIDTGTADALVSNATGSDASVATVPAEPAQSTFRELPVRPTSGLQTKPIIPVAPVVTDAAPSESGTAGTPSGAVAMAPAAGANALPVRPTVALEERQKPARVAPVVKRSSLPLRRNPQNVSVQAGAFKSQENAQKLANRLLSAGVKARTEFGEGFYRVIVGPYRDEATARAASRGIVTLMR